MEKIVVLAIPVYFGTLLLEAWFSARQKKGFYHFKDSLGNLGTGILMQMLEVFSKAFLLAGYVYVFENFNFNIIPWDEKGILSWIVAFLAVDFVYYLFHRHSHEVNLLWAAHVVHHSSEQYNFSVALRQSAFQGVFQGVYLLALAVIGIPPMMIAVCFGLNLIYQFFLHTRYVSKLGIAEYVLNTPSHHRVHHARQGKYLDRNYAGVLIIWDRMFNTFMEEAEEPKYGVYPRFQSYDPVRANYMPIVDLAYHFRKAKGRDKWRVLFSGPLWLFENYKKGKNLNVMESSKPVSKNSLIYFGLAMAAALVVLFVPQLETTYQSGIITAVLLFLGLMGKNLDY